MRAGSNLKRIVSTVAAAGLMALLPSPWIAAEPSKETSLKRTFYVAVEGSPDSHTNEVVAVSTAQEFQKLIAERLPPPDVHDPNHVFASAAAPWVLPLTSGGPGAIIDRCRDDPQTIGGVVLTYYSGYATHYYILWQSETTTFSMTATLIKCNAPQSRAQSMQGRSDAAPPAATAAVATTPGAYSTIIGVINILPGSNGTPWVVRKTQISIPLLTFASLTTLLTPKTTSKTNNITFVALAGSLFSGANSKDVPGYSDPVRLRSESRHIADDVVSAGSVLCKTTYDVTPEQYALRAEYCNALGIPTLTVGSASPAP